MTIINLALHTVSEANSREHWAKKAARSRLHRAAAKVACREFGLKVFGSGALKLRVTLTRIGKRKLDSDNLAISFKHVRDGIAEAIGIDDGSDFYTWEYKQEIGKQYGVKIELETTERMK